MSLIGRSRIKKKRTTLQSALVTPCSCCVVDQLKRQAADRQRLLEEARGLQSFQQRAKELQRWTGSVQDRLLQEETAGDVASALALLDQHQELRLEMEQHKSR